MNKTINLKSEIQKQINEFNNHCDEFQYTQYKRTLTIVEEYNVLIEQPVISSEDKSIIENHLQCILKHNERVNSLVCQYDKILKKISEASIDISDYNIVNPDKFLIPPVRE